jgi:uncharacterized protein (UPF0276 family)
MSQDEFFCPPVAATGCGLLLDVADVHINAMDATSDLLDVLVTRVPIRARIIEQDANLPNVIEPLSAEIARSGEGIAATGRTIR